MSGLFKSKKTTATQQPLTTPEQDQARQLLLGFGQTGQLGGFQAGQAGDLSGFQFNPSDLEMLGLSGIQTGLEGGTPQGLGTAQDVLTGLATQKFDPSDPSNPFAAFSRQVARATGKASDQLNQEAAITGDRFGTKIAEQKTDLAAQQSDILTSKMGDLFSESQGRSLQAALGLGQLSQMQEQINQSRIAQAFQFGGIQRDLQNQEAQTKYSDWLRSRDERLNSISFGLGGANQSVNYGVKSATAESPSPFSQLMSPLMAGVGLGMGGPLAGWIGGKVGGLFGSTSETSL